MTATHIMSVEELEAKFEKIDKRINNEWANQQPETD